MFSVSLFFIVLRKLSTHPKPQVSQESGGKSQSPSLRVQVCGASCLHVSSRCSSCLQTLLGSESPRLPGTGWGVAKPLSHPSLIVPPSGLAPRTLLGPLPSLWPSLGTCGAHSPSTQKPHHPGPAGVTDLNPSG